MKITLTQDNFKKAIYNTERVVSKQNTLPILNNILFETYKGGLKLTATNLEIGIQVKTPAKVEGEGKITIPARLIGNFSSNLSGAETVVMESHEQGLKIKNGSVKAIIKGMGANEFPIIPQKKTEYLFSIPVMDLKLVISKIITCVAHNEARQELTGINLILGSDKLIFASTDSFRLSEYQLDSSKMSKNNEIYDIFTSKTGNVIIPANTIIELNRIISGDVGEEVKIAIEDGQIFFDISGVSIVSRLINGKYPEYKHIIPEKFETRIVGEKTAIQSAIKMASVFAVAKGNEIVLKVNSEEKKAYVSASSQEAGENTTELKFDMVGPSQEVVFNAKYLLDGINACSTSKVAVLLNSASAPVAIKEINEQTGEVLGGFTYIVMPIKN